MTDNEKDLDRVLKLLDETEQIDLDDDFNRAVLARVREEKTDVRVTWYKPAVAFAVSVAVVLAVRQFGPLLKKTQMDDVAVSDRMVIEHLELLEKMDVLEHLDVYLDTATSNLFLQLLEKQ
ncbi:hypothetical protein DGMP_29440 [Desulfomarina profundi]|uniref:Uncharacterized protein n=1 Tax=Desulfomarina profundi TaxID=2772557 RepID=A0A8D5FKH6_9BACT|nr:hypothetical protein [Desulfomarina profundi]BCL62251.1 hypothetical protein DGMP_29440 [Desulfomarina profundi]